MSNPPIPEDVRGRVLQVGDTVCYTTAAQTDQLRFGIIQDIVVKDIDKWGRQTKELKVKVFTCDVNGTVENNTVYNYNPTTGKGEYVDTGKPQTIWMGYSTGKFLIL